MKRFSTVAVSLVFAAIFAVSASAQTGVLKVVVINTLAFDGKDGIVKYTNAMTALDKEVAPLEAELQGLTTKYTNLGKELQALQTQIAAGKVPVDQSSAQAKAEEYASLELTIKRKQEDGKKMYERRQAAVMAPLLQDIGKAMQDFSTAKGYDLILDASKMDQAQLLLAFNPVKVDVTKEFITYYNALPARTASTTTPK